MSLADKMRRVIRLHPLAAALFGVATLAALIFAVRTVVFAVYWSDPAHRDVAPRPWMTPRYIAMSWDLPPEDIAEALKLEPPLPHRPTLADIARQRGIPVEQLIAELTAYLAMRENS